MDQTENIYSMKITDMNLDCLEECLQHLSIDELLNVADTNNQLRHAARNALARVFKGKVNIRYSSYPDDLKFYWNNVADSVIKLYDLKLSLSFLRCFGDLVYDLKYGSDFSQPKSALTISYVNEYCSEFVTKIHFEYCPKGCLNQLTKPFKNVDTIVLSNSYPGNRKLNELFPNLRRLKLLYLGGYCSLPNEFLVNLPLLQHLTIKGNINVQKHYEDFENVLLSNPQMKCLSGVVWADFFFSTQFLLDIGKEAIQNLEKLRLYAVDFKSSIDEIIHLKNLKVLKLYIEHIYENRPWTLPFRSDKLESLEIIVDIGSGEYTEENVNELYKLIANYPSVKKLTFYSLRLHHLKISKALPLLEEIDFFDSPVSFTVDDVVHFVDQFPSLKSFRFRSDIPMNEFVAHLGTHWLASVQKCRLGGFNLLSIRLKR